MCAEVGAEHLHIRAEQHKIRAKLLLIREIIEQAVGFHLLAAFRSTAERVRCDQLRGAAVVCRELLRKRRFKLTIVPPAAAHDNGEEVQRKSAKIQEQNQRQYGRHIADEGPAQQILKRFTVHGRPSLS